ncbi:AAA family ATPase [Metallosphaera hakonensis JCM 8857 = DSM 7519]|uniref:ATPase n=1 Tax=Metallosphaera hakonensis JCM 8857 = DSM 7519 TaxID=1293036 RepID=A0A2U9IXJ6_9CREN|nr:AAA family ATPase [Metallosphaera hakonensis JCM 8857 = DSM 7519]
MLFDERPKENRGELFDRAKEIEEIKNNIDRPLILLTGVRRIGKTSVMQVTLNEIKRDFILIDCRKLKENYGRRDLYALLSSSLTRRLDRLRDVLKKIHGIQIMGNSVEISWGGRNYLSLADLFDHLNERRLVIAVDEAQRLRGPLSREVREAIAHAYDYDRNLSFILTGSEVGLLHDFLGIEDQESPLFGRYYHEVVLERFSREDSRKFLETGFQELGVEVGDDEIDELINLFDGIPGWLAFAGIRYARERDLRVVAEIAVRVAQSELESLIKFKDASSGIAGRRYKAALRCLAEGSDSWAKLKICLEETEKSTISSSVLANILHSLEKLSLISDYHFLDPVYEEASKRLR